MVDLFSKLTLEVILSTAFGVDANIQMGESTEVAEIIEKAHEAFRIPPIVRTIAQLPFGNSLLRLLAALQGNENYFPVHGEADHQNPTTAGVCRTEGLASTHDECQR